ncbi:DUF5131 family protein [Sphingomonas dokdonensis]|uniref:Phage protein Gp37/Gp68 n=1 Tax=Sphingomonas dokdonensis TaxID=344880 RepID=A0A245ZCY9_9SPHN|nr:phage Gp37/Gp68 family protein [Sphingomonas dokdonensis]OWK27551.1 phage protein Gp37/Gp68 [Sphingomonas dokdonensis]
MADTTKIEWTDATWNIINGCSIHTPGCTNCYAMLLAGTRLANHPSRVGLTTPTKAGPVWNGTVRLYEPWLTLPLEWARPRDIFVCAHGDLFHDAVTEFMLDQVFAVMALCAVTGRRHRFQVLTKRSGNMRRYVSALAERAQHIAVRASQLNADAYRSMPAIVELLERGPLPNVMLGVSTEDQRRADERIPDLLATPAAMRWISAEPLLGPIDLEHVAAPVGDGEDEFEDNDWKLNALLAGSCYEFKSEDGYWYSGDGPEHRALDWVVVGGESGRGARPMHPAWARSLRDQCASAGVPFLFKQWGEWAPVCAIDETVITDEQLYHPRLAHNQPEGPRKCKVAQCVLHASGDGFDMDEWSRLQVPPGTLVYAAGAGAMQMMAIGKRRAGRLLDGVQHDGAPS